LGRKTGGGKGKGKKCEGKGEEVGGKGRMEGKGTRRERGRAMSKMFSGPPQHNLVHNLHNIVLRQ